MSEFRYLTEGEKRLGRSIYGNSIDYDRIKIYNDSFFKIGPWSIQEKSTTVTPNGNMYFPPSDPDYKDDFSAYGPRLQSHFIHELGHVYQHQHGENVIAKALALAIASGNFTGSGDKYQIKNLRDAQWKNLNIEQRAEAVAKYWELLQASTLDLSQITQYERILPRDIVRQAIFPDVPIPSERPASHPSSQPGFDRPSDNGGGPAPIQGFDAPTPVSPISFTPLTAPSPVTPVAPLTPAAPSDFSFLTFTSYNSSGGYSGNYGRGGSADIGVSYGGSSSGGGSSSSRTSSNTGRQSGSFGTPWSGPSTSSAKTDNQNTAAYGGRWNEVSGASRSTAGKVSEWSDYGVGAGYGWDNGGYSSGGSGGSKGSGSGGPVQGKSSISGGTSTGYWASPVLLDISGEGLAIDPLTSSSRFIDLDGDGYQHRTAWAGAGTGVLIIDANGDGKISQSNEFAFTEWDSSATSDLEALKHIFDTNGNGKLDSGDAQWSKFRVEVNGQLVTLDSLGITSIDLTPKGS
ncbi:hypothetical protein E0H68_37900, partial [Rhizobium leguminosarum bv. viciae]